MIHFFVHLWDELTSANILQRPEIQKWMDVPAQGPVPVHRGRQARDERGIGRAAAEAQGCQEEGPEGESQEQGEEENRREEKEVTGDPTMELSELGRSGIKVSPVCLGGNVFGWTADEKASLRRAGRLHRVGGNFIDTANVYSTWVPGHQGGESETVLGKWLKSRGKTATRSSWRPRSAPRWATAARG